MQWFHPQPHEMRALAEAAVWEVADLVVGKSGFYWAALRQGG